MKKMLVFAVFAMIAGMASAQLAGIGNSYIYDVGNDDWYEASGGQPGWVVTDFNGFDFGIVSSLTLGGQVQTWAGEMGTTATMFWEVFDNTPASVASGNMNLAWINSTGGEFNNNDTWENIVGQNVASGLSAGDYTVAVWYNAVNVGGSGNTVWDSNSSANYVASFEVDSAPIPEPATMSLLGLGALAMVLRRKMSK